MGEFNFGQFQEIFEYLMDKLNDGEALTPEEQQIYDLLVGFAGQGLNLTNTGDFQSLYQAFNSLADEDTKKQFEKLYGEGFAGTPEGGVQFTRPGALIEQMMRRGLSVNDGPAMALLSEGLQEYMATLARNKFAGMTNAYAAMTPIRGQNLQALIGGGNVAQGAANRRGAAIAGATSGARAGGEGAGELGEPLTIDTKGEGGPEEPGFFDKFGPALIGLLGTGALGIGGFLLKDWWNKKNQPQTFLDEDLDAAVNKLVGPRRAPEAPLQSVGRADTSVFKEDMGFGSYPEIDPYGGINPSIWTPQQTPPFDASQYLGQMNDSWYMPPQAQSLYSPQVNEQNFDYQDFSTPSPVNNWATFQPGASPDQGGGWNVYNVPDASYDPYSWSGSESSGYWV